MERPPAANTHVIKTKAAKDQIQMSKNSLAMKSRIKNYSNL